MGIWKLPNAKDEDHKKMIWREDWLGEITKTREVDRDKVFTSEKNFHCEDIETSK